MGDLVEHFLLLAADAPKATAPGAGAEGASGILGFAAPLVLIGIIFYFLLIRPQKRGAGKTRSNPQGSQEKRSRRHHRRDHWDDREY